MVIRCCCLLLSSAAMCGGPALVFPFSFTAQEPTRSIPSVYILALDPVPAALDLWLAGWSPVSLVSVLAVTLL